jgi:hypothetical protein
LIRVFFIKHNLIKVVQKNVDNPYYRNVGKILEARRVSTPERRLMPWEKSKGY